MIFFGMAQRTREARIRIWILDLGRPSRSCIGALAYRAQLVYIDGYSSTAAVVLCAKRAIRCYLLSISLPSDEDETAQILSVRQPVTRDGLDPAERSCMVHNVASIHTRRLPGI